MVVDQDTEEVMDPVKVLCKGDPSVVFGVNLFEEFSEKVIGNAIGLKNSESVPEKDEELVQMQLALTVRVLEAPSRQTEVSKISEEVDGEGIEIDA
jgi:hypothetical protein